jgi:hypothetical protein
VGPSYLALEAYLFRSRVWEIFALQTVQIVIVVFQPCTLRDQVFQYHLSMCQPEQTQSSRSWMLDRLRICEGKIPHDLDAGFLVCYGKDCVKSDDDFEMWLLGEMDDLIVSPCYRPNRFRPSMPVYAHQPFPSDG